MGRSGFSGRRRLENQMPEKRNGELKITFWIKIHEVVNHAIHFLGFRLERVDVGRHRRAGLKKYMQLISLNYITSSFFALLRKN